MRDSNRTMLVSHRCLHPHSSVPITVRAGTSPVHRVRMKRRCARRGACLGLFHFRPPDCWVVIMLGWVGVGTFTRTLAELRDDPVRGGWVLVAGVPAGEGATGLRRAGGRARWRCTRGMVAAPSPTAEATRLTDPWRTSPAANTPGRLVSSGSGGRPGGQRVPAGRSGPVRMNPCRSRATVPASHCVRGCAPIRTNKASAGTLRRAPETVSARTSDSRWPVPVPPATCTR